MKIGVYAGTFDPLTLGHIDILERSCHMFDKVILAISKDNYKTNFFNLEERVELAKQSTKHLPEVEVQPFDGLLVKYCEEIGACAIIRGLRALSDFDNEFQMALMNKKVAPQIESVFLMTAPEYQFLSSSMVKKFTCLGYLPDGVVPQVVEDAVTKRLGKVEKL